MIICGNVFIDELHNSFLLQCVLCEKKLKAYNEFKTHVKSKHKPEPEEVEMYTEHEEGSGEEKIDITIEIKNELDNEEGYSDGMEYEEAIEEEINDPILTMEEVEEFEEAYEFEDEEFALQDEEEEDEYDEDFKPIKSENSTNTDKFSPTFFRKQPLLSDFLDLYKSQSVLWDVNHPYFEDPEATKEAENVILEGMQKLKVVMDSAELNRAFGSTLKSLATVKYNLETPGMRKQPDYTLELYNKCDFLKDLLEHKNIYDQRLKKKKKLLNLKQSDATTATFIDVYSNFPVLYDGNHEMYGDLDGRQDSLQEFANEIIGQHDIDFTDEEVMKAIQQLQSWFYTTKQRKEKQHSKVTKAEEKYYKKCDKFLPEERLLYQYVCKLCKKNFKQRHNLQSHLFESHQLGELPFQCDQCELKFKSNYILQEHVQRRHIGKSFPCKYCEKKFTVLPELKSHIAIHENKKPHVCELCGKAFRLKTNLGYHVTAIHTKIRAFKCTMCPKDFLKRHALTDHLKSHLNIRDKICETCGKGFTNCHSLIRHRQIHSEVKKYACKLCDAKFHQFVGLNGHMKRTHNVAKDTE